MVEARFHPPEVDPQLKLVVPLQICEQFLLSETMIFQLQVELLLTQ